MNRAGTVSRGAWIALALGAGVAGGGWFAAQRWQPVPTAENEHASLSAQREQLRGNEDDVLDQLRREAATRPRPKWTTAEIEGLSRDIGPGWDWSTTDGSVFILRRIAPLDEWTAIQRVVARLADTRGIMLEAVELNVGGAGRERQFTKVEIHLRLATGGDAAATLFRPNPSGAGPG